MNMFIFNKTKHISYFPPMHKLLDRIRMQSGKKRLQIQLDPDIKVAFGSRTIYLSLTPSSSMSNVVFSISVVFDRRSESGGCFLFLEKYLVKFAMSQYFTPFTDDQPCQPCSYAIVNCILWCQQSTKGTYVCFSSIQVPYALLSLVKRRNNSFLKTQRELALLFYVASLLLLAFN